MGSGLQRERVNSSPLPPLVGSAGWMQGLDILSMNMGPYPSELKAKARRYHLESTTGSRIEMRVDIR